jgi:hypothetical protein
VVEIEAATNHLVRHQHHMRGSDPIELEYRADAPKRPSQRQPP